MSDTVLELDVGNTAVKWRLVAGSDRLDGGRCAFAGLADLLDVAKCAAEVRVASVASAEKNRELAALYRRAGVACRFARSQVHCGRVSNSYADVSRMGVDRWLAIVAAFTEFERACLVVDVGTALTMDVVDGEGRHRGGYILPGPEMMARALVGGTDRVRFAEEEEPSLVPGTSTEECVHHGKWLAVVAAIAGARRQAQQLLASEVLLVLTGGASARVMTLSGGVSDDWQFREDLVLDGLAPVLATDRD